MARTVKEIQDSILASKANYEELNGYTSPSATALVKLFAYIFAYAAWTLESLFDLFKADVNEKLLTPAHNALWYQQQALAYQRGDDLIWNESQGAFTYLVEDNDKKIVARAAAVESSGRVTVKAVKLVGGQMQPLTSSENSGLQAFLNRMKDAGVRITSRSWLPDDLMLEYDIIYDPLLIASDGTLLADSGTSPIQDAIDAYIEQLDFNGRFSVSKLEDAIQAVPGVVDFQRIDIKSRHSSNDFTAIEVSRVAESGYMKLHDSSSITYTASNV